MRFSLLDILLPRETKFYTMLSKQADILKEGCSAFTALVTTIDTLNEEEIKKKLGEINSIEQKGDDIEHQIIEELHKTFITPIDREDIHLVTINLDKCLDILNSIAKKIEIYKIRTMPHDVTKFTDIIREMVTEVGNLVAAIKTKKEINAIIGKMHAIENKADYLFHMSVADLFTREKDAVQIIKFKEIYEHLEEIVDSMDFIGKLVRGVMVKVG
jgi:predicted phosphate transport protein (TIGR00153 family)